MFLLCGRISKYGDELNAKCTSEPENARMPPWNNTLEMRTTEPIQQEPSEPYVIIAMRAVDRARGGSEYCNPLAAGHRDISISTVLLLSLGGRVNGQTGHSGVSRLTGGALSGFNGGAFKLLHNEHEMMRSTVIEHVSGSRRACPHLV